MLIIQIIHVYNSIAVSVRGAIRRVCLLKLNIKCTVINRMDIINIDVIIYITLRSANDTLIITVINARLRRNRSINIIICRHPLLKRSAGNLTCDNAGIRVVRQYSHPCCQFLLCCVIGVYSAHVIIANTIYKRVQQCLLVISPILAVHDLTLHGHGCTKLVFLVDTIGNRVDLCFGQGAHCIGKRRIDCSRTVCMLYRDIPCMGIAAGNSDIHFIVLKVENDCSCIISAISIITIGLCLCVRHGNRNRINSNHAVSLTPDCICRKT